MNTIGNPTQFSIKYEFFDDSHETKIGMFVNDKNILEYKKNGYSFTTCWNLDELALWLRGFVDNLTEDPYPVEAEGKYAAIKDIDAREFDSEDEDEFDAYYDKLDEWNLRHRWHPASSGAILSDVYFQLVGDAVELSWANEDGEEDVEFVFVKGGCKVPKDLFVTVINDFLKEYELHWSCG